MLVVSNTSPLLNLAIIDHLFLLPEQFGQIHIPTAVLRELKIDEDRPGSVHLQSALEQGWLISCSVGNMALVNLLQQQLHQGESEAIALAVERSANTILLDEKEAREAARTFAISMTGVLGILLRGWYDGSVISLTTATERLQREANFRIAPRLLQKVLQESGES